MSRRSSPARDVDAVADRLHSAAIHLLRRLRTEDEALGVSPPRLSALSVVVYAGPIPIGELASAEGVRPPTMTRLVDGLEHDGLVKREPHPEDRRGVVVRATPKGVRRLTRGRARRVEVLAEQLRALPRQDLTTLATAADLLERVARTRGQA
ncbi:MAG TPA: MarR family transcriptional regulator [Actinomycetota bacterium]|nr:MarR family transcriptional regulator [Actinomycetota bacterium]